MDSQTDLPAAPIQIAALALAWRSLETAQRDRERRIAAVSAQRGFEAADLRASLAAAIDADTEAQVLLLREISRAPARDIGDVMQKLGVLRDSVGDTGATSPEEELVSSIITDMQRLGGFAQAA